ncbi:MAG TPA: carotenoid biosynthesis protein, partial [Pseudomonadota bacterium]|nr:carotenoid biosynthesis protein [Pseudomonadota bacterium]
MSRSTPWKPLLSDYFALSVAGYLGEESCITLYHFYQYSPDWNARLVDVPLLVPLIWPLVVLSARQVGQALWPDAKSPLARAAITAALVTFDASLMEVVAVRAGLWSWAEPGHLQVPLIGILGWGYFALGAELVLGQPWRARRLWLLLLAPLVTNALIVGSWWICFRHALRGDLGQASVSAMAGLG